MELLAALASLDPLDETLWTTDGLPRLDVVSALTGTDVKRKQVVEAAPEFTRSTLKLPAAAPAAGLVGESKGETPPEPKDPTPVEESKGETPPEPKDPTPTEESKGETPPEPKTFMPPAQPHPHDREFEELSPAEQLAAVDATILELQQDRGRIEKELGELAKLQDRLQRLVPHAEFNPKADQAARMAIIQGENARRLAAATRSQKLTEATGAGQVIPAPIDRSFGRRGAQRPRFPTARGGQA